LAQAANKLATRTTTGLLDALHDQSNDAVWSAIDARYRPVIAALAVRLGLRSPDADEVAQQALAEFVRSYKDGRYDRTKGRLSSWILGIAHHTALKMMQKREGNNSGTMISELADEQSLRTIWTDERDRTILAKAMDLLRDESEIDERTLLAFELVALRGVPAIEAGEQAQMTVDQVYVAKNRVTRKLRVLVEQLTEAFEEDV
jgi:RNA polymerase sigma-70 factor (ECF subfamily)